MSFVLDGIIILIIAICIILSAKKGFVATLVEVIGFIAALVIAFVVSTPLAGMVYDNFIEPSIIGIVENAAEEGATTATDAVDAVWNKLPGFITESNFFNFSKENITSTVQTQVEGGSTELALNISNSFTKPPITKILSSIISVIIVTVMLFLIKPLAKLLNKLFSFSVIGDINKTLGGVLGLIKGVAISIIVCLAVSLILSFTKSGFLIFTPEAINSSFIFKFIIGFSPFL